MLALLEDKHEKGRKNTIEIFGPVFILPVYLLFHSVR